MTSMNVYCGTWGEYIIPHDVYSKVKRWKKSGFPYQRDAGRVQFMQWVAKAEGEAMNREIQPEEPHSGASKVDANGCSNG